MKNKNKNFLWIIIRNICFHNVQFFGLDLKLCVYGKRVRLFRPWTSHIEDICETNDDWTISLMQLSIKLERNWRLFAKFVKLFLANDTKICWKFVERYTRWRNEFVDSIKPIFLALWRFVKHKNISSARWLPLIRDESIHDFRLIISPSLGLFWHQTVLAPRWAYSKI